jgi:hypothetical protein
MAKVTGIARKTDRWRVTLWRIGCGAGIAAHGRSMEDAFNRAVRLAGPSYIGAGPDGQRDIMSDLRGCWIGARDTMRNRRGGVWRRVCHTDATRVAGVDLERIKKES